MSVESFTEELMSVLNKIDTTRVEGLGKVILRALKELYNKDYNTLYQLLLSLDNEGFLEHLAKALKIYEREDYITIDLPPGLFVIEVRTQKKKHWYTLYRIQADRSGTYIELIRREKEPRYPHITITIARDIMEPEGYALSRIIPRF